MAALRERIIQQQLFDYAKQLRAMPLPAGTPGKVLLEHIYDFEPGEVDEIMRAVEEGCERIV